MPPNYSIPIIPTAGFTLGQGFANAIDAFNQARVQQQQLQRQKDMQDVELWQQILPGLAHYTPAGMAPINNGALADVQIPTTETVNTPAPPQRIADALQRLTGQTSLNLLPQQVDALRNNALGAATFADKAKLPGAELAQTQAQTGAANASTAMSQYDLSTRPAREASVYADSKAPAYIGAAIAKLGAPNGSNNNALIDRAFADFQQQDNSPYKQNITRDEFGRAVQEYWIEQQKLGLEGARVRLAHAAQNDPRMFLDKLVDNYGQNLRQLEAERVDYLGKNPMIAAMMSSGNMDAMAPQAKAYIADLTQRTNATREAYNTAQNRLAQLNGLPGIGSTSSSMSPAPAPTGQSAGYGNALSVWQTAPDAGRANYALQYMVNQKMITQAEADAIKRTPRGTK